MAILHCLLSVCLLHSALGYYALRQLSYTQLPTGFRNGLPQYAGLFKGTAEEAAYDFNNDIIYVIGEESHLLHVIDIHDPSQPNYLFAHTFTVGEGMPHSVAICDGELAVALSSAIDTMEGHVRFFKTHDRSSTLQALIIDGYVAVGSYPDNIRYTQNCTVLVVANEGRAGLDFSKKSFVDPQGSVTLIYGQQSGNPSVQLVDFWNFAQRKDIRAPGRYVPVPLGNHKVMTSLIHDLEPEYVAISSDGSTAYVTLQENDAIATVDLHTGLATDIHPLPRKDWSNIPIDASDRDGGVHRQIYTNLKSIRQPDVIKIINVGGKDFLITGDEGAIRSYKKALHTFDWTEAAVAKTLVSKLSSSTPKAFRDNVDSDEFLGRLLVSKVEGTSQINQQYEDIEAFGGRGFSIWDPSDFSAPVFDSDGSLEEYEQAFDESVFNTDCIVSTYQSPQMLRDTVSNKMGPEVNGLDVAEDNGTTYLVVGDEPSGFLFLYTVDTATGTPFPQFQSVTRSGVKDVPWNDLYLNGTAAGDAYIADLGIIPSNKSPVDRPLVYVVGAAVGSLSIYEIIDDHRPAMTACTGKVIRQPLLSYVSAYLYT